MSGQHVHNVLVLGAEGDAVTHARVRMVAQPASVPAARRFVDDALTGWGNETLIEDVSLCVTELSTNATLHSGSGYFEVELQRADDSVRLAVLDTGHTDADSLAARTGLGDVLVDELLADEPAATGRGMFIVSALASTWGIDELPDGKRVWAEFRDGGEQSYDAQAPVVTRRDQGSAGHPQDPDDWAVVRFIDCPAALLIAHDENLSDSIRELQLIGSHLGQPSFARLAQLLSGHVQKHAVNWDAARIMAREAVRAGQEFTSIDVLTSKHVMEDVRFLRELIWEAEALARAGKLMTLPARQEVQVLRDWLESEFRRQAEQGLAPVPYRSWLAEHGG